MGRRSGFLRFASGAMVFPGGKLDPEDYAIGKWRRFLKPEYMERSKIPYLIAAARELWEETGVVLSEETIGAADRSGAFDKVLAAHQAKLDIQNLPILAHWITPLELPRRLDTHFYVAPMPKGQTAIADGSELIEVEWTTPKEMLARAEARDVYLMPPTIDCLNKLAKFSNVRNAMRGTQRKKVQTIFPTKIPDQVLRREKS